MRQRKGFCYLDTEEVGCSSHLEPTIPWPGLLALNGGKPEPLTDLTNIFSNELSGRMLSATL